MGCPRLIPILALAARASGAACEGKNLKSDALMKINNTRVLEDSECGSGGMRSQNGDRIVVNYIGRLYKDCSVFESTKSPVARPDEFTLGEGRQLTLPADYAYGPRGLLKEHAGPTVRADVPPGAAVVFDVELLAIGERPEKTKKLLKKGKNEKFG